MNIRKFDKSIDHKEVSIWWLQHSWAPVPLELLPETGFIIEGLCAGFLYRTDSKFAILEFVIANPNADKQIRSEALDILIERLVKESDELGYKAIFSSVEHPRLIEKYKNNGFKVSDTNMTNLTRVF